MIGFNSVPLSGGAGTIADFVPEGFHVGALIAAHKPAVAKWARGRRQLSHTLPRENKKTRFKSHSSHTIHTQFTHNSHTTTFIIIKPT